jgi:AcrR family transcriptional regulator
MTARKKQAAPTQTRKIPGRRPGRKKVPGRRPGRENSRGAIVDAARARFARDGYEATTIRGVASDAGVDPSLVMQFYGSKEGLFLAMIEQTSTMSDSLLAVLAGPRSGMGGRLTRAYLELWEDPITGDKMRSLFRAAIGSPRASRLYQNAIAEAMMQSELPVPRRLPSLLAVTHLLGTAIGRYLIEIPVLVAPSVEELVRLISPAVDGYLGTE